MTAECEPGQNGPEDCWERGFGDDFEHTRRRRRSSSSRKLRSREGIDRFRLTRDRYAYGPDDRTGCRRYPPIRPSRTRQTGGLSYRLSYRPADRKLSQNDAIGSAAMQ